MEDTNYNHPIEKKSKLLRQVRGVMRTKHKSIDTEETYLYWIPGLRNDITTTKIIFIFV